MIRSQRSLALLVAGAFFMENLDGTIVANAAPSLARSFGVRSSDVAVTMTTYLVTLAVLIPLSGWIADRYGAKRVFAAAITIFTVASGLCAASPTLGFLVGMRVLQGIGGAMMVPVGRLVVLRTTDKQDLIRAVAYLTWPALVAPVLAPVLGGVFTTYLSWHWIFLVNLPLGAGALVWALRIVPNVRAPGRPPLDWLGFGLAAVSLAGVTYLAALVSNTRIDVAPVVVLAVVSAFTGAAGGWHLLRAPEPLVDLRVLRIVTFRVSHAGGSLFRLAVLGVPILLPLMFQDGFGWSPVRAGAMVVFVFVGNVAIKPLTTTLLRRFGFRSVLVVAIVAAAASMVGCAVLDADTPLLAVAAVLIFGGVFRSIGFTAYNTIAFADVDAQEMTHANTLSSTIQQLALGLGVAFATVSLRIGEAVHPSGSVAPYRIAFLLMALVTAGAVVEALRLPADAGAGIGGGAARRSVARLR